MTDSAAMEPLDRPRVLLAGDVAARPEGLERALTRAGFRVVEDARQGPEVRPDAILLTTLVGDEKGIAALLPPSDVSPPRVIIFAGADPDLPGTALRLGADDALGAPVHLAELCARLHARIRDRVAPTRTPYEREVREALQGLLAHARLSLLPEEIVLALVRRLARAYDLAGCAFVSIGTDPAAGKVVAQVGAGFEERDRLELRRYPEIVEALRTRRPMPLPDYAVALPVVTGGGAVGVLLMRRREGSPPLGSAQLELAASLAQTAAVALGAPPTPSEYGPRRPVEALTLERKLQEEFERARRYHLSFSLVLLAIEALDGAGDLVAGELRGLLRLPDFVTRYRESEFAIVLPETGSDGARRSIGRMRDRLAGLPSGPLSAGIVTYPHPAAVQPDDLFALVEAALSRGRSTDARVATAE